MKRCAGCHWPTPLGKPTGAASEPAPQALGLIGLGVTDSTTFLASETGFLASETGLLRSPKVWQGFGNEWCLCRSEEPPYHATVLPFPGSQRANAASAATGSAFTLSTVCRVKPVALAISDVPAPRDSIARTRSNPARS